MTPDGRMIAGACDLQKVYFWASLTGRVQNEYLIDAAFPRR
jgi:hypothetical protein